MYFKIIKAEPGSKISSQSFTAIKQNYQYRIGLNSAPDKFYDDCFMNTLENGDCIIKTKCFYFATAERIASYYLEGNCLATVELPVDEPGFHLVDDRHANMVIIRNVYPLSEFSTYDLFGLPYPSLDICASMGYFNFVKYWVETGVATELKTDALSIAVQNDDWDIVKYLVSNGADISKMDIYSLSYCCLDMIKFLVANGGHHILNMKKLLFDYVYFEKMDEIKYLVEMGVDIHHNNDEPLTTAIERGSLQIVTYLVENGANIHANNDSPIITGASHNQLEIVKFLVKNGANIHAQNDEAVKIAAKYGHLDMVNFLVENGADIYSDHSIFRRAIDQPKMLIYLFQKVGNFRNDIIYLHCIDEGYLDVVKYFLENNIYDIHYQNDIALRNSAFKGNTAMVKYLVENGADIAADNYLALKWAVDENKPNVAKYLLGMGADINVLNDEQKLKLENI